MATIPINDTTPRNEYTATAGQTVFPYTFWITEDADLKVYQNGTLLTLTTDYTVSGALSTSGGDVTLVTGATVDDTIIIERDIAVERTSEFTTGGTFTASVLNTELSTLIAILQQLKRDVARKVGLAVDSTYSDSLDMPAAQADYAIGWNSSADGLTNLASATDIANAATNAATASSAATAAGNAQTAAEAALDSFDDTYLGQKSSDPATDNDGDPLATGALYFNTTSSVMKVYTGSAWQNVNLNALVASNNLSDVDSASASRGNLGLTIGSDVQAYAAALDAVDGADTIASATTTNIGAATARKLLVTGTNTITGFDTVAAGTIRKLVFDDALTLTHNATSLILPGGANITTASNDAAEFVSLGSGNWLCMNYSPADGSLAAYDVLDEDDMASDSSTALSTQQSIKAYVDANSTGAAKAWVNFNGTGTIAIRDSYGVDSITDLGTGRTRITFTNAMANTNYLVMPYSDISIGTNNNTSPPDIQALATTHVDIQTTSSTGSSQDHEYVTVIIYGDLA